MHCRRELRIHRLFKVPVFISFVRLHTVQNRLDDIGKRDFLQHGWCRCISLSRGRTRTAALKRADRECARELQLTKIFERSHRHL